MGWFNGKGKESDFTGCGDPPFTVTDKRFFEACSWHDAAYTRSSWHQLNLSRYQVDRAFLEQMLQIANGKTGSTIRAYTYYWAVRIFGALWWEGKS